MRWPLRMGRIANAPRPWMRERRTSYNGDVLFVAALGFVAGLLFFLAGTVFGLETVNQEL